MIPRILRETLPSTQRLTPRAALSVALSLVTASVLLQAVVVSAEPPADQGPAKLENDELGGDEGDAVSPTVDGSAETPGETSQRAVVVVASVACAPCRRLGRDLRAAAGDANPDVAFAYIDCRDEVSIESLAARTGAWPSFCLEDGHPIARATAATPTVVFLNGAAIASVIVGAPPVTDVLAWFVVER